MNIKAISRIVMTVILLAFIIPQVTFAVCLWPLSDFSLSLSHGCPVASSLSTDSLSTNNSGTSNTGNPVTSNTGNSVTSNTGVYNSKGVSGLFDLIQFYLSRALILLISLAVVWFVWNVFRYAVAADEVDKAVAKERIIWGVIAIFVMVSIWGLVAILQYTFQIFPSSSGPKVNGIMPTFNFPQ